MGHPDRITLQSLVDGALSGAAAAAARAHLDGCAACKRALAELTPGSGPNFALAVTAPAISLRGTLGEEEPSRTPASDGRPPVATPSGPTSPTSGDREATGNLVGHATRIGRYEVEAVLGTGGLGVVYAARDPELGRRVALKLLKAAPGRGGSRGQSRLLREAQAMARLSHPNVVQVYDVGEWEDRVFVAMELIEGGTLRRWLTDRPRSSHEIVDVFLAAGAGLAVAHAASLMHRDFKPDNVLVSRTGQVRVGDFGLARSVEAPVDDGDGVVGDDSADSLGVTMTKAGAILGTPAYMSPEQHEARDVDARTDQFAFSVALYEALFRQRPFGGESYPQLRASVLAGQVRPPPARARVPRSLQRIVLRGLARRPGDRWPSMAEMLAALARDRRKPLRIAAALAAGFLAVFATAGAGDLVVRTRVTAAARASFAATRAQVASSLALRYEAFATISELSMLVPIMLEVAATRDEADFGLGSAEADRERLAALHESLRDADWELWASAMRRGAVAVADYKGRLLYSTAAPDRFGVEVRRLAAVDAAYRSDGVGAAAQVLRADDEALRAAGLAREGDRGLVVLFARTSVLAGAPQATFIQAIEGKRMLADLTPGPEVRLAMVAPDGGAEGELPADLLAAAAAGRGALVEVDSGGRGWLVQSHPVPGLPRAPAPIALLVLARPVDVGIAGLFPHARAVLLAAALAALAVLAASLWRIRVHARP